MSSVTRLLHTRYRVNDLAASVKFYTEALGLKVSRQHTSPRGAQLVFLATPGSVEDLVQVAAAAAAKGYPLSDGPTVTGSGSIIAFLDAPEGYEIELIQRAK